MTIRAAQDALISKIKATGYFDHVAQHEPYNAPGRGRYVGVWFDAFRPSPEMSTLSSAAMVYTYRARLYKQALAGNAQQQDAIDIDLVDATDAILSSIAEDHRLGESAFSVDFLGAYSDGIHIEADYVDFDRNQAYRVMDIFIPVVVDSRHAYE